MSDTSSVTSSALELDLSGRQLGNYRLLRRLGRGAMAEVYLAEQQSLRRQVALKLLKRDLANDATYVRRFHMEAQAAAALVHANIVQIYEVGCVDGVHFISQEYVAGQNLRELLGRKAPDVKLVVSIMRQVAAALAKAGEQGIVHRDIKPENIMLTKDGEVKVADFGLARITTAGESLALTQTGMTMGTPLYMSPEQVEGRSLDPRSDIYSFGVTCYHMLAGEPPFRGETALSVAVQHLRSQPERLETQRPDLPAGLARIVHKMLAKAPSDRYPTARDLLRDLRTLSIPGLSEAWPTEVDEQSATDLLSLGEPTLEATRRLSAVMKTQALQVQSRRRLRLGWTAGALAAFLVGGAVAMATRPSFMLDLPAAEKSELAIQRMKTPEEQYLFAVQADTEAAWKSVEQYFPKDKVFVPRAKQQLAWYYLQHDQLNDAQRLFEEFSRYDKVEKSYRAFGLAGELVIDALKGQQQEAANKALELSTLTKGLAPQQLEALLDRRMVQAVGVVLRKNLLSTDKTRTNAADWDKWLDSHFREDAPAAGGAQ